MVTQGSQVGMGELATLGFGTESRWDSGRELRGQEGQKEVKMSAARTQRTDGKEEDPRTGAGATAYGRGVRREYAFEEDNTLCAQFSIGPD